MVVIYYKDGDEIEASCGGQERNDYGRIWLRTGPKEPLVLKISSGDDYGPPFNKQDVRDLIAILQCFVDTGSIKP